MKSIKLFALTFLICLTSACAGFSPTLDQQVETGDNALINQQATQADGSNKVDAENVESVTTINEGNVSLGMLITVIAGAGIFGIVFGILIPQPAFIKKVW